MNKEDIDFEHLQLEIKNKLAQEHNWKRQEEHQLEQEKHWITQQKHWITQGNYWIAAVAFAGMALLLNFFK